MVTRLATAADHEGIVSLFELLTLESGGTYPRERRVLEDGGMSGWLRLGLDYPRWVVEEHGKVIGHGQILVLRTGVEETRDYYERAFPGFSLDRLAILQRLAIAPGRRREGLARELIRIRVEWALACDLLPAVVISRTQVASNNLYREAGWQKLVDYRGFHDSRMTSFVWPRPAV